MLRPVPVAVAVLAAVSLSSEIASSQSPPVRTTLDNGLEIVVVENHAAPLATVLVAVRNGSFVQQPGEEGLAHLYEHVVFRGYGSKPGDFETEVGRVKGSYNGGTSEEVVTYYLMVPAEKAADAIGLLARALFKARFESRDVEQERPIVLDELGRRESDPEGVLARRVSRELWGNAWYRKDVGGDSASLQGISLDRLRQVYDRYYMPNNAALIVTGDVSASGVVDVARRQFGDWKARSDSMVRRPPPPLAPLSGNRTVAVSGSMQDVTLLVAWRGPGLLTDTAGTYAAEALCAALNRPTSGLQLRLVDSGLFQSVAFSYRPLNEPGALEVYAKTTSSGAIGAFTALLSELDHLDRLAGPSQWDLTVAAKRREVAAALDWEQTAALAPDLASWWASGGLEYYLTHRQRVDAQSLDDLRAFVRKYLSGAPRVVGVLAPAAVTARLAEWLQTQVGHSP